MELGLVVSIGYELVLLAVRRSPNSIRSQPRPAITFRGSRREATCPSWVIRYRSDPAASPAMSAVAPIADQVPYRSETTLSATTGPRGAILRIFDLGEIVDAVAQLICSQRGLGKVPSVQPCASSSPNLGISPTQAAGNLVIVEEGCLDQGLRSSSHLPVAPALGSMDHAPSQVRAMG